MTSSAAADPPPADPPASESAPGRALSLPLLAAALAVWALSTFGHGLGLDLVADFFVWARQPGALVSEGGQAGFARGELLVLAGFAVLAVAILAYLAWRLRRTPPRLLAEAAVPWVLWAGALYLTWQTVILYTTELVHFAQYALVGLFLCLALGRGRRPQLAFVVAVALGVVDEAWQHYGLHQWILGEHTHWMDWSDLILDALGACAGILPAVTLQRLRPNPPPSDFRTVKFALAAAAVLLLPLLLLDPVTTSSVLGSYPYYPFWDEHANLKAVHWLHPHEGIPLFLGALLVLGTVLEPRPRPLSQRGLALLVLLLIPVVRPESRATGRAVHEVVPTVRAPHVADLAGVAPPLIDGRLDDPAWAASPRLGPFVNAADGTSWSPCTPRFRKRPLAPTHARVLWDDEYLYVAFEVGDGDIWARDLNRDHGGVAGDEGLRVFVDDGGDEITYYEFDLSPANALYDAFSLMSAPPLDFEPWARQIGLAGWSSDGVRSAVAVRGKIDRVEGWTAVERTPASVGYTAELAIPWEAFRTTTTPSGSTVRTHLPPHAGDRWRLGLYRSERPRPVLSAAEAGQTVDGERARELLGVSEEKLAELVDDGQLEPGENGTFGRHQVAVRAAQLCAENQAWSPPYRDFHQPARFGVLEFARTSAD